MKTITIEIADKEVMVTALFRPALDFFGKNVFCYQCVASFFDMEDVFNSSEVILTPADKVTLNNKVSIFIFDIACQLLKKKKQLVLSFDLPYERLNDMDYLATLYHQCLLNDVRPQHIELTISEHAPHHVLIASKAFLNKAKEYGFRLSLDDFGTGNLQNEDLHLFHFDTIKIARTLIIDIATDTAKQSKLQHFISESIPAGTHVICDGADKEADLALLQRFNSGIKGYVLRRPLTYMQLQLLENF